MSTVATCQNQRNCTETTQDSLFSKGLKISKGLKKQPDRHVEKTNPTMQETNSCFLHAPQTAKSWIVSSLATIFKKKAKEEAPGPGVSQSPFWLPIEETLPRFFGTALRFAGCGGWLCLRWERPLGRTKR